MKLVLTPTVATSTPSDAVYDWMVGGEFGGMIGERKMIIDISCVQQLVQMGYKTLSFEVNGRSEELNIAEGEEGQYAVVEGFTQCVEETKPNWMKYGKR